ncbi:MAG TPA: methyltransferase domain-containing protein [Polyangiaceae bacterium]|nr:methyltransferase domain-containing protein [Polyangiaceae bacterium]
MNKGGVARFFDAIAAGYDRSYAPPASDSRVRMKQVIAELPAPPARVLDLGVGTGRELPALLDAGHRPTGVDVSRAMLARCARRARPVPLVHADFWETPLPFEKNSFDAAIALHGTLAHPDDLAAVRRLGGELGRVVRRAGRFVAEVPSTAWLDAAAALPADEHRRVIRTGERTCLYEDTNAGVSIRALLLDEDEWADALSPHWKARIEPRDNYEWLVIAERV